MISWALLWGTILISLYTDLKSRMIYNKVVMPAILLGVALNTWQSGVSGMVFSIEGLLVGLGIFLIPFLLGGIGAGDVKLMGAVGAIMGFPFAIWVGLGTGIAGGVVALVILIKQGKLLASLRRISLGLNLMAGGNRAGSLEVLDREEYSDAFPYGVAIALGTLAATVYWF